MGRARAMVLAVMVVFVFGCAQSTPPDRTDACDWTPDGGNRCNEWDFWNSDSRTASYDSLCRMSGGVQRETCPGSGRIGGCSSTFTDGTRHEMHTDWYYAGTEEWVRATCVAAQLTFASP